MLRAESLTVGIGERTLVRVLTVAFRAGETWALLGANGSGKTTLLHTLAGLRPAADGHVTLDGTPLAQMPARIRARAIGVLFQHDDEVFPSTVLDHVLTGRHPHRTRFALPSTTDIALAQRALANVQLAGFESRLMTTLSGGERRRVELATLLVQDARVLLMDEPTNHLDMRYQSFLARELSARGSLRIAVLHDVNLAQRFCTHALLLFNDGSALHGPSGDVITRANLERAYGCTLREVRDAHTSCFLPD
jgi:iron complex transport system ATP-binding protein